jgi:hypothetical protein
MKGNLFKKLCSLYFGLVAFILTGNAAFADIVAPSSAASADLVSAGPLGPRSRLILILGIAVVALAVVAVAIVISIRKKNAR